MDLTFDMSFIRKRENYSRAVYNTMDEVLVQNILHAIIGRLYKKKVISDCLVLLSVTYVYTAYYEEGLSL